MNLRSQLACIAVCAALAPLAFAQMTATHRTTADGRPLASSLPSKGARVQPHAIAFSELPQHLYARVIVTTEYGDHREGHIDSVSGSTLRLKISVTGGTAVTNFERGHIRSITLLD